MSDSEEDFPMRAGQTTDASQPIEGVGESDSEAEGGLQPPGLVEDKGTEDEGKAEPTDDKEGENAVTQTHSLGEPEGGDAGGEPAIAGDDGGDTGGDAGGDE